MMHKRIKRIAKALSYNTYRVFGDSAFFVFGRKIYQDYILEDFLGCNFTMTAVGEKLEVHWK